MSPWTVPNEHIDALVTAGLNVSGDTPLSWLHRGTTVQLTTRTAQRVGTMLLRTNQHSAHHATQPATPSQPAAKPAGQDPGGTYVFRPAMVIDRRTLLQAIDCLEYWSRHAPEWESSEAAAFCRALRAAITRVRLDPTVTGADRESDTSDGPQDRGTYAWPLTRSEVFRPMPARVEVLHNVARDAEGRHAGFDGYQPGHHVVKVFEFTAEQHRPDVWGLAELAFAIGQREPDLLDRYLDKQVAAAYAALPLRSVSVGDLIKIGNLYLKCDPVGFTPVSGHRPVDVTAQHPGEHGTVPWRPDPAADPGSA
jgi:hypothetical protein